MAIEYDFNNLNDVYNEALKSHDKTMIFESRVGRGRFLFMMFLSDEDKNARDLLFLYLRNINRLVKIKLYGNHGKGCFKVYLNEYIVSSLTEELQLNSNSSNPFNFNVFLNQLNENIPLSISNDKKLETIRHNREIIKPLNVVDEKDKTVLKYEKRLPKGQTPQDKTLRKLYIYTDSSHSDISELICILKKFNITVCWTTKENKNMEKSVKEIINNINLMNEE